MAAQADPPAPSSTVERSGLDVMQGEAAASATNGGDDPGVSVADGLTGCRTWPTRTEVQGVAAAELDATGDELHGTGHGTALSDQSDRRPIRLLPTRRR